MSCSDHAIAVSKRLLPSRLLSIYRGAVALAASSFLLASCSSTAPGGDWRSKVIDGDHTRTGVGSSTASSTYQASPQVSSPAQPSVPSYDPAVLSKAKSLIPEAAKQYRESRQYGGTCKQLETDFRYYVYDGGLEEEAGGKLSPNAKAELLNTLRSAVGC